jgi:hypothetical protein
MFPYFPIEVTKNTMIFPYVPIKSPMSPPFQPRSLQEAKFVGGRLPGGFSIRGLSGGERRRLNIAAGGKWCGGCSAEKPYGEMAEGGS